MNAIGKAARVELAGTGVHVLTVCPGYVATDFAVNAVRGKEALRISAASHGISVERAAKAVFNGYLKNKREVVVPWTNWILITLYRFWPGLIEFGMKRMLRPAEQVIAEAQARKSSS
jgi:uncharacterized protein